MARRLYSRRFRAIGPKFWGLCPSSWQIHGYNWPPIHGNIRRKLEELKVDIVERTPSTLSGDTIDYGLARYGLIPASWVIAETLEVIGGYGLKTAVEGILVATDSGTVPPYATVISVAGTGSGADTAILAKSTFSASIFSRDPKKDFKFTKSSQCQRTKNGTKKLTQENFTSKKQNKNRTQTLQHLRLPAS